MIPLTDSLTSSLLFLIYAPYMLHKKMCVYTDQSICLSIINNFSLHEGAVKTPLFDGSYNLFQNFFLMLS